MADSVEGRRKRGLPSQDKARKMLHDNSAQGHPLTPKQKGFLGIIAGGGTPTRMARRRKRGK